MKKFQALSNLSLDHSKNVLQYFYLPKFHNATKIVFLHGRLWLMYKLTVFFEYDRISGYQFITNG